MFENSKNIEYKLFLENDNQYKIALIRENTSEVKWLSFSSDNYFLVQGAILGSLKYNDYVYQVEKVANSDCCFFKIISKKRKTLLSRESIEVVSGKLVTEKDILSGFLSFINELGMKSIET